MANTAQARKRVRQAERSRLRNVGQRSNMRTILKKVQNAITGGDKAGANNELKGAISALDTACSKGLIHKNKAARDKSRLNKAVQKLA